MLFSALLLAEPEHTRLLRPVSAPAALQARLLLLLPLELDCLLCFGPHAVFLSPRSKVYQSFPPPATKNPEGNEFCSLQTWKSLL